MGSQNQYLDKERCVEGVIDNRNRFGLGSACVFVSQSGCIANERMWMGVGWEEAVHILLMNKIN